MLVITGLASTNKGMNLSLFWRMLTALAVGLMVGGMGKGGIR